MSNYSQTQIANFTVAAGIIVFFAKQIGWDFGQDEIAFIIASLFTIGGTIYNFWQRFKKGDIALSGRRLNR